MFVFATVKAYSVSDLRQLAPIRPLAAHLVEQLALDNDQILITVVTLRHGHIIGKAQMFAYKTCLCVHRCDLSHRQKKSLGHSRVLLHLLGHFCPTPDFA